MRTVIVLGHEDTEDGGWDPGAVGPTGLEEEDVVQAVAKKLVGMAPAALGLEFKRQPPGGHQVLLDTLRANPPDRMISLHCNAGSPNLHEAHTYYWRHELDDGRLARSKALAEQITAALKGPVAEKAFVKSFPINRRWPDGSISPLTPGIMKGTGKRAVVLVELGFISDFHVEAAMRTEAWQERAARTLLDVLT